MCVPVCVQVGALSCSGGVDNLVLLDRQKFKALSQGVCEAGVPLNNDIKWKAGEAEFESLMRMLDNVVSEPLTCVFFYPSAFEFPALLVGKCPIREHNEAGFIILLIWVDSCN